MKKGFRRIGFVIAALIAAVVIYLVAVLMTIGEKENYAPPAAEQGVGQAVRVVHDTDAQVLADAFGADAYVFPDSRIVSGTTGNAVHAGRDCCTLRLSFENGCSVICVRPASAAPLIREAGMTVMDAGDVSVCNLPAQVLLGSETWCAYFSGESASYCVSGTAQDLTDWLQILSALSIVSPSVSE